MSELADSAKLDKHQLAAWQTVRRMVCHYDARGTLLHIEADPTTHEAQPPRIA